MRFSVLAASLVLIAGLPSWSAAQIKLPVFNEAKDQVRNVVFEDAAKAGDFQHGKLLRITLAKDPKATIQGVLVRTDPNTRSIYLRTEPGAPPRAIAEKDIKSVEKGVIKQVAFSRDVSEPEIQPLVIYNGGKRTVTYEAPTLSPGELATLADLETAENQLARLEQAIRAQQQAMENDMAMQKTQQRTRELANQMLAQETVAYNLYGYQLYARGLSGNSMPASNGGWNNMTPMGVGGAMTGQLFAAAMIVNPSVSQAAAALPNLATSTEALAAAQRRVATARRQGYFENGRLVAVVGIDANAQPGNGK